MIYTLLITFNEIFKNLLNISCKWVKVIELGDN